MADAKIDITDELLVAYVDNELDEAQRSMVRSVLDTNPALSRRAAEMRLSRDLLREAFPLRPDAIVPPSIDAAANRLAKACAARASQPAEPFRFWNPRTFAIAAAVALCGVIGAGYLASRNGRLASELAATNLMRIDPGTALHRVLETAPSAEVTALSAEDAAVRAVLTFRAKDGRFCREFEILAGSGGSTGIACREQDQWRAEVLLSAAAVPPDSNYYEPAGEQDEPALAEVAKRLMQGDPLGVEEEAQLIARGWQESPSP